MNFAPAGLSTTNVPISHAIPILGNWNCFPSPRIFIVVPGEDLRVVVITIFIGSSTQDIPNCPYVFNVPSERSNVTIEASTLEIKAMSP